MHAVRLDHATINTADVAASVAFYGHFLGLTPGWRPAFGIGGAWLYPEGGDYAIVHLIEAQSVPEGGMFNHVAFRGTGLAAYLAKLRAHGEWYRATPVPETSLVQVHHYDPNGVLVEVNFLDEPLDPAEARRDPGDRRPNLP